MKNKKTLIIILAFVLVIGGATVLYRHLGADLKAEQLSPVEGSNGDSTKDNTQKIPAPDFTVYDQNGNEVRFKDYIGKPIVLNFWASWCGPCQMEMPAFQQKYKELGDDIHFLMINRTDGFRETVKSASSFIEKNDYTFPIFFDTESEAAHTYGAYSLPITFFIDAQGYVVTYAAGSLNTQLLQMGIDMII